MDKHGATVEIWLDNLKEFKNVYQIKILELFYVLRSTQP